MQNEITPFLFENEHMVRTVVKEADPWFVGPDIAQILGHRDANTALRGLDDDEKGTHILRTLGGPQEVIVVSEPGVYQLMFTSRKPVAVRLRRWLAHEVIPSIRKTGSYTVGQQEVFPPPHPEQRRFPDWTMEEFRTKGGVVDRYRYTYGIPAAQWIMPQLGFPVPPPELVNSQQQYVLALVPVGPDGGHPNG